MQALILAVSLLAIDPNAGTTGFDFLKLTPTAREAALGSAVVAAVPGPMGFWYSPAHALSAESPRAQVGYLGYVAGIRAGSAAYSQPLGTDQGIGLGLMYLNSGTMKRTNEQGDEMGTFGVSYADLNLSGAMRFDEAFGVGLGLQGLYGSIDTFFTMGLAGNVGATYRPSELPGLTLGLAIRNVGYQLRPFQAERNPMPIDFGFGLAFKPDPAVSLVLDAHKPIDNRVSVRGGVEGWVADLLALRVGYNSEGIDLQSGGGTDILAGLSTGLGIRHRGYVLDYCFIPMLDLGVAHRLSLAFSL